MIACTFREFIPEQDTQKPFDCGNTDLNGFLLETGSKTVNASSSAKELLTVTYIVEDDNSHEIIAYFSLLHDKIERHFSDRHTWNRLSRYIPNAKRRASYPALKIGRLAVNSKAKAQGLSRQQTL
ncbi:MAG: hypothetical protein IK031_07465 [Bacteroidales bacterium]|nr:hypothetical protein [Bacteroidales bacterium]